MVEHLEAKRVEVVLAHVGAVHRAGKPGFHIELGVRDAVAIHSRHGGVVVAGAANSPEDKGDDNSDQYELHSGGVDAVAHVLHHGQGGILVGALS